MYINVQYAYTPKHFTTKVTIFHSDYTAVLRYATFYNVKSSKVKEIQVLTIGVYLTLSKGSQTTI